RKGPTVFMKNPGGQEELSPGFFPSWFPNHLFGLRAFVLSWQNEGVLLPARFRALAFRAQLFHASLRRQRGAAGARPPVRVRRRDGGGRVRRALRPFRRGVRLRGAEKLRQMLPDPLRQLVLILAPEVHIPDRQSPRDLGAALPRLLLFGQVGAQVLGKLGA